MRINELLETQQVDEISLAGVGKGIGNVAGAVGKGIGGAVGGTIAAAKRFGQGIKQGYKGASATVGGTAPDPATGSSTPAGAAPAPAAGGTASSTGSSAAPTATGGTRPCLTRLIPMLSTSSAARLAARATALSVTILPAIF
jgi:hypothetical protein